MNIVTVCLTSPNPFNSTFMFIEISRLPFKCVDKTQFVIIQMNFIEQYFHVVLFSMLYKVVLTF